MNDLQNRIQQLKKEKNAVILAHYYVHDEVQQAADYIGDSFYLSRLAATTEADTIVFCGVSFMGESAKILSPEKTVLMPDGGLSHGAYGGYRPDPAAAGGISGSRRRMLHQFYGGAEMLLRCMCHLIQCTEDRKKSSQSQYIFYTR